MSWRYTIDLHRLWAPTSASRTISAVTELLVTHVVKHVYAVACITFTAGSFSVYGITEMQLPID